jgi:hypothetical protein
LQETPEILRRWSSSVPPCDEAYAFARLKLVSATNSDLKRIGLNLEALGRLRNAADYQLTPSGPFGSARSATLALVDAESAIALFDAIEADQGRRAAPVGSIPRDPFKESEPARGGEPPRTSRATSTSLGDWLLIRAAVAPMC